MALPSHQEKALLSFESSGRYVRGSFQLGIHDEGSESLTEKEASRRGVDRDAIAMLDLLRCMYSTTQSRACQVLPRYDCGRTTEKVALTRWNEVEASPEFHPTSVRSASGDATDTPDLSIGHDPR